MATNTSFEERLTAVEAATPIANIPLLANISPASKSSIPSATMPQVQ